MVYEALQSIVQFDLQTLMLISNYCLILSVLFWLVWRGMIKRNILAGVIILVTLADLLTSGTILAVGATESIMTDRPKSYAPLEKEPGSFSFLLYPEDRTSQPGGPGRHLRCRFI